MRLFGKVRMVKSVGSTETNEIYRSAPLRHAVRPMCQGMHACVSWCQWSVGLFILRLTDFTQIRKWISSWFILHRSSGSEIISKLLLYCVETCMTFGTHACTRISCTYNESTILHWITMTYLLSLPSISRPSKWFHWFFVAKTMARQRFFFFFLKKCARNARTQGEPFQVGPSTHFLLCASNGNFEGAEAIQRK